MDQREFINRARAGAFRNRARFTTRPRRVDPESQQSVAGQVAATTPYTPPMPQVEFEAQQRRQYDALQQRPRAVEAYQEPRNQFAEAGQYGLEMTGLPSVRRSAAAFADNRPQEGFAEGAMGALSLATLGVGGRGARAQQPRPAPMRAIANDGPQPGSWPPRSALPPVDNPMPFGARRFGGPEMRNADAELRATGNDSPTRPWPPRNSPVREVPPPMPEAPPSGALRPPLRPVREIGRASDGSVLPVRAPQPFRQSFVGGSDDLAEAARPRSPDGGNGGAGRITRTGGGGFIEYEASPDGWRITDVQLDPALRGKGNGVALYEQMLEEAAAAGVTRVFSDNIVSQSAEPIYAALRRRGYTVTASPRSAVTRHPNNPRLFLEREDGQPIFTVSTQRARSPTPPRQGEPRLDDREPRSIDAPGRPGVRPQRGTGSVRDPERFWDDRLTDQQNAVARWAMTGRSANQIADEMASEGIQMSPGTVRVHLHAIKTRAPDVYERIGPARAGRPASAESTMWRALRIADELGGSRYNLDIIAERLGITREQASALIIQARIARKQGRAPEGFNSLAPIAALGAGGALSGSDWWQQ